MKLNIFIDGASRGNPGPASVGVVLQDNAGKTVKEYHRYIGTETNNVAEYTALDDALKLALGLGATSVKVHTDSQLLQRQLTGVYKVKNERLWGYLVRINKKRGEFRNFEIVHVRRELNKRADKLANMALDAVKKTPDDPVTPGVYDAIAIRQGAPAGVLSK